MKALCLAVIAALMLVLPARAVDFPPRTDPYLNDLAGVFDAGGAAALRGTLAALRRETGVEMSVLTIGARRDFGNSASIEDFARELFNDWALGDAQRNDGILILVAVGDREMRLALGSGYARDYDVIAGEIVDGDFLPPIRAGDIAGGIGAGVQATIDRIARPFTGGDAAPRARGIAPPVRSPGGFGLPIGAVLGFGAIGVLIYFRRRVPAALPRCPDCGQPGLQSRALDDRTVKVSCPACGFAEERPRNRRSRRDRDEPSGGGGRSAGGGATGRW